MKDRTKLQPLKNPTGTLGKSAPCHRCGCRMKHRSRFWGDIAAPHCRTCELLAEVGGAVKKAVSSCNYELKAAGSAYPRTCALCGLGKKCVKGYDPADVIAAKTEKASQQRRAYLILNSKGEPVAICMTKDAAALVNMVVVGKCEELPVFWD